LFAGDGSDRASAGFRATTQPRVDLAVPAHADALLRWLNAWGCRIAAPQPGGERLFEIALGGWWERWGGPLPSDARTLAGLDDAAIDCLVGAFADLAPLVVARSRAGHARTMAPTAAAKALHALRPAAVLPWDDTIARTLHGARDAPAFAAHLRLGRRWAQALLDETGLDEPALLDRFGRPDATLAKLLDEYCYTRFTAGR
jgi:hypothetical protein